MDFLHKLNLLVLVLGYLSSCCSSIRVSHMCRAQQVMCLDSFAGCISQCRGDLLCQHRISTRRRCNREYCYLLDFECPHEGRCIPSPWVCDGKKDCIFGFDELNCTTLSTPSATLITQKPSTSTSKIYPEVSTPPSPIPEEPSTLATPISKELSTFGTPMSLEHSTLATAISKEPSTSATPISKEHSKQTIPITQDTSASTNTIVPQSARTIDAIVPETSIKTSAIFRESSCPENYCMQNADCVSFLGQYRCNCPPSFSGKWCEIQLDFGQDVHGCTLVTSIAVTTIILCLAVASVFIYLYRKSPSRYSNILRSKTDSQLTLAIYAKEQLP